MSGLLPLGNLIAAESLNEPIEVIVRGRVPGPPLWEIRHGGNTVYLFADISPIPKKFNWDSRHIEKIISEADEFLSKPVLEMGLVVPTFSRIRRVSKLQEQRRKYPEGLSLEQFIDQSALATFTQILADWEIVHPSIMRYKPFFAAYIIYGAILEEAKMEYSDDVPGTLESLRRKHRVRVTKTELKYDLNEFFEYLEEVKSLPGDFGIECFDYLLEKMRNMPAVSERARLWYQREISFKEFTTQENMCTKNYSEDSQWHVSRQNKLKALWYENLENAITSNKNTFAVVDMNLFALPSGEFYQWLEAKGYTLKEPR